MVLVTTHVPFRDVPALLTLDRVVRTGRTVSRALREWWGIERPRLAVCAVNPHAGESGLFGDEEERVLRPAAEELGPRARCRLIRCSSARCGESSTQCLRPITTWE